MDKNKKMEQEKKAAPENYQKKLKRDQDYADLQKKVKTERREKNKKLKQEYISRAQKYQKEYQDADRDMINKKRQAKAENSFYVPSEAKVAFVIRIKGVNKMHPDRKAIMRLLRLRQMYNATFVRINKASINMLRKVQDLIAYGYPSTKTIKELIYKRGYAKINGQRIPIDSNKIIEEHLGKFNIICMEDLIHEIVTCGPHFKQANNFLWTFKLRTPRFGFNDKNISFQQGGDWGNREELINEIASRMI
eukprot:TRINITY_DN1371_c0_g1_i2.p1 TRINITY_DN1371_c0_g1~~TRINITY_DN1371_c0_g1_i2.p1  ORF type:complete len:249 (+),score=31.56 TRINITY_DN1371_c0_g1_i2:72-818(+)